MGWLAQIACASLLGSLREAIEEIYWPSQDLAPEVEIHFELAVIFIAATQYDLHPRFAPRVAQ